MKSEEILTPEEAADLAKVSKATLLAWVNNSANPCPAVRLGPRTIRISKAAFLDWLQNATVKP